MYMYIYLNVSSWGPGKASGAVHRPESQQTDGRRCQSESEGLRTRQKTDVPNMQSRQRWIQPFYSSQALSGTDCAHPHWGGRVICFAQSTDTDANLFGKYPHRHTQKQCLTCYLSVPDPVKLTHKSNDHTSLPPSFP